LPEWMTADVGGFVWRHPAFTAFSGLIAISAVAVGASVWLEAEGLPGGDSTYKPLATSRPRVLEQASPVPRGVEAPDAAGGVVAADPDRIDADGAASPGGSEFERVAMDVKLSAIPAPPAVTASTPAVVADVPPAVTLGDAGIPAAAMAATTAGTGSLAGERTTLAAVSSPPGSTEVEALLATFVSSYEYGRLDAFANLFDIDAQTNLHQGRAAIRSEYDQLFRATAWRRMGISNLRLQYVGDRAEAKGEVTVNIRWRDGRSVEQRGALDMELVRRGDKTVIVRLSQAQL